MTTLIDDNRVRVTATDSTQYFYFYMALSCTAVAFLGFAPTYFMPLAKGSFSATPVIHVHGIIFFAWSLFFVFQTWLAASGRLTRHRSVGMIGISLATAMTIFGFLVGGSALIGVKILNLLVSPTHAWHSFAGGLLALAQ